MLGLSAIPALVFLCHVIAIAAEIDVKVDLKHSLDGHKFTSAGTLNGFLSDLDENSGRAGYLSLQRSELTNAEQQKLQQLISSNGLYKLQLPSNPQDPESTHIVTSIPARCLVDSSGLDDHLVVHATRSGRFVGFNHDFTNHPCTSESIESPAVLDFPESSVVPVWLPAQVPILTKSEPLPGEGGKGKGIKAKPKSRITGQDGEGNAEEAEEDTRPWIVRNWMIAVPLGLVAFNILTAVAAPAEGGGQAQAPAGQRRR